MEQLSKIINFTIKSHAEPTANSLSLYKLIATPVAQLFLLNADISYIIYLLQAEMVYIYMGLKGMPTTGIMLTTKIHMLSESFASNYNYAITY